MQECDDDVRDYAWSYYVLHNYAGIAQNTNLFLDRRYMQDAALELIWVLGNPNLCKLA